MRSTIRYAFTLALTVGLLAPTIALTDQADQTDDDRTELRIRGAKAWANNCARCHHMRAPNEFRDDQWKPIVFHMRVRAGLTGQETRAILEFLQSAN